VKHAGEYYWEIALNVECPHCFHCFDANNTPDFWEHLKVSHVCEGCTDCEVSCPKCGEVFRFDIMEGI
jgi:hypothetical protein